MNQDTNTSSDDILEIQIGNCKCGTNAPSLFIAEEGQASEGDHGLALKMIDLAAQAGADGIEFQLSIAGDLYVKTHEIYRLYKSREFQKEQIKDLISSAHEKGMLFFATCLSDKLTDIVVDLGADVVVVNATDLTNIRMLEAAANCGKPFLIATLLGTLEEIDWAVSKVSNRSMNFGILHGQHVMGNENGTGVPVEYAQLDCIHMMEKRYGVPIGFVDHSTSEIMPSIAASRGAMMVTKHLSPCDGWRGPDWQVCLEPEAWKRSMLNLKYSNAARGSNKNLSVEEISDRSVMRRSIVAAKDIQAGKILELSDIDFKRPGGGLDPSKYEEYIGRKLVKDLAEEDMLMAAHLSDTNEREN